MVTLLIQYEQYPLLKNRRSVCIPNKKYSKLIGIHNLGQHPNFFFSFNITWTTDTSALKYICHLNIIVFLGEEVKYRVSLYYTWRRRKEKLLTIQNNLWRFVFSKHLHVLRHWGIYLQFREFNFKFAKYLQHVIFEIPVCKVFYWSVSIYLIIIKMEYYSIWHLMKYYGKNNTGFPNSDFVV